MCGLVGIFDSSGERQIDRALLRRMNDRVAHRGPDGAGEHFGPGLGLGHRRLAIIDVGGGRQPLYNEDGSVVVVFNGEIYNYRDIIPELEAAGHVFHTHSDTEVIVHAWEEWGERSVEHFRGMFAFALWDETRQTLFIARDRLGKKPLYYALLPDGTLVFGSELKSVMVHPGVSTALDPWAVDEFFAYGYVPDPRSIYRAVRKLPPAHWLLWRRGAAMELRSYWDLRFDGEPVTDLNEAKAELVERLNAATRLRLVSDVPLGAFLSGGVDSSAVVALMAGMSSSAVKTFSISFGDRAYDESAYAQRMAERYSTDHHARAVTPDESDPLSNLAARYDEPFGDSSAMPTYRVCQLARERVTVALSGDGGDELFGGYRRYALHHMTEQVRRTVPTGLRHSLFGMLGRVYPKADWAPRFLRAKTTFQELGMESADAYFQGVSVLNNTMRRRLFSDAFRRDLQGYCASHVVRSAMAAADTDDDLAKIQYADIKTWLPGGILVKVDRASMATSLEVRSPLLDHELAEWSMRLAPSLKLKGREGKLVLKRAVEPYVDRDLLYRPKRGFSMPLLRWLRGPWRGRLDTMTGDDGSLAATGLFNMSNVRLLVDQHLSGQSDHSAALWLLLMFEAFLVNAAKGEATFHRQATV
ncbi:XrtA/PEP-CTERM system amidotransferase [Magnetospirillum molischianum]|uniref:asparagine synthase (glutamine-hydrolyzing) n=1 Tax=Magnetospirillum molischianum DSM 120 TaxID=1150626 RepID=H8FQA7_MAGML|nr:XrtA/PEP-CTERM system amidotransferase [Magnetospirillum molischianum]CCG40545.1 Exosortase 1 system-associated amidotransferase 1 [Magnetospirillum molischianum DSM 120]